MTMRMSKTDIFGRKNINLKIPSGVAMIIVGGTAP